MLFEPADAELRAWWESLPEGQKDLLRGNDPELGWPPPGRVWQANAMVEFRTSMIESLTEHLGLSGGMRAAARMIRDADEVLLDAPHETAEFVARTLGKSVRRQVHVEASHIEASHVEGRTPSRS